MTITREDKVLQFTALFILIIMVISLAVSGLFLINAPRHPHANYLLAFIVFLLAGSGFIAAIAFPKISEI